MSRFSPQFVAESVTGEWVQPPASDVTFDGVSIDSREEQRGRLFVAIKGETHDGHDHVAGAIERGAAGAMVERWPVNDSIPAHVPVYRVDATRPALAALAGAWRQRLTTTRIIGITGTCGKTTTKTMLHTVLSTTMRGSCAPKSFNNEIGVPLSILATSVDDTYAVLEIGTNGPGEIEALTRLAEPDVAVITMIGRGHLEGLGSVEAVATEKAGILRAMRPRGLAIVNGDAATLRLHLGTIQNVLRFGAEGGNDLHLTGRGPLANGGQWFEVNGVDRFELPLPGRHNALNALAVIAVARSFGLEDAVIQQGLSRVKPAAMRLAVELVAGVHLMNDAYNANPESMAASFETFTEVSKDADRRIVILGEMLELGDEGRSLHTELGRRLLALHEHAPLTRLELIGPLMRFAYKSAVQRLGAKLVRWHEQADAAVMKEIAAQIEPGDWVLLKGSRRVGVERIAAELANRASTSAVHAE